MIAECLYMGKISLKRNVLVSYDILTLKLTQHCLYITKLKTVVVVKVPCVAFLLYIRVGKKDYVFDSKKQIGIK